MSDGASSAPLGTHDAHADPALPAAAPNGDLSEIDRLPAQRLEQKQQPHHR